MPLLVHFKVIPAEILKKNLTGGLDSVVDNALACHLCGLGSNPGQGMWQGSGRLFSPILWFPPPHLSTVYRHPHLRECVNKFLELSVKLK